MSEKIAIVGIGCTQFRTMTSDLSYKELMFEAAVKAYEDAGINPRKDVSSFITVSEDFWEGTSIFDEYVPDQLGGAMRPVCTIGNEGIHGIITAAMQIMTGGSEIVVVESHSKLSEVVYPESVLTFGIDPVLNRPLGMSPHAVAGLEMRRFLHDTGNTREDCAEVVVKNRKNALENPLAAYGAKLEIEDVLSSQPVSEPLNLLDMSQNADGAIVIVLAAEHKARKLTDNPVWISGMGWCNDTPTLESRDWSIPHSVVESARMAYRMAGIKNPVVQTDFAEIDDTYSYKELQHIEALGLCGRGESGKNLRNGVYDRRGEYPINVSGGSLGIGNLIDANGLAKIAECVRHLRGDAGSAQLKKAGRCIVQSWRGVPTTSSAVLIMDSECAGEVLA